MLIAVTAVALDPPRVTQDASVGLTWLRQREIVATATGKAKDLILAKQIDANASNDEVFALAA